MHFYGKASERHPYIVLGMGGLGVGSAFALYVILSRLKITVPFYLDMPSTLGFFGFWYWLFDAWLWRTKMGQCLLNHSCDNFAGEYKGRLVSSFDSHTSTRCSITIRQTYSNVSIVLETQDSRSKSIAASIAEGYGKAQLHYAYENYPLSHACDTMHRHSGMAVLEFKENMDELYMEYYTGKDREKHGHGTFKRVSKK